MSSLKCRSQRNYNKLFQLMGMEKSVMISYIDDLELLIFTSELLHADSRGKSLVFCELPFRTVCLAICYSDSSVNVGYWNASSTDILSRI